MSGSWVDAITNDNIDMFKRTVNAGNINQYSRVKDGTYTPIQYLARKAPPINFKGMLQHCLELNADLTLNAETIDCIDSKCTTIGNLASYRQSKGWSIDPLRIYKLFVQINNGEKIFNSELANKNALQWKGMVPGIGYTNSLRRLGRGLVTGVAKTAMAPVRAAGAVLGAGTYVAGTLLGTTAGQSYLGASAARWGGARKSRKNKNKNKSKKTRANRR